ncbi:MAG: pimeloyl-ACP methyl ester carboxylesterase [Candidatus Azotimanducaceae bacterium]|jgi:pimeloyl-ACP methyl ester carboxylesterase
MLFFTLSSIKNRKFLASTLTLTSIVLTSLMLSSCELGTGASDRIIANYHLLDPCEKSDDVNFIDNALCGVISVPENRHSRDGRQIDLNIMLLPATSAVVLSDPIFFLAGGPGQSAVDAGPGLFSRLREMRTERDIILVDQRGTGNSNSLSCELNISTIESMSLSVEEFETRQTEKLKSCLEEYDADPSLYTTPNAMDDLNEVREKLGYEKINLYGISYGTRAALVYLRRHESTVRSMIIDSVVPLTMTIPKNVALDAQSSFALLLEDCKSQPGCHEAFPDLHNHLRELVQRLQDSPEDVSVLHPRTGIMMTGPFDPVLIGRVIRSILYNRTLSRLLPLAIEEAWAGNYQPLSTLGYAFTGDEDELGMSMGMMASVLCSEDMTLISEPNHTDDFDNAIYRTLKPVCEFWPKGDIPQSYFDAVESDVPVLITSGELDPITPPKYGTEAALTLSNSRHLIVAGVGHAASVNGCLPKLMSTFLEDVDPANLDATCADKLKRLPFFTSYAGALSPMVTDAPRSIEEKQND